MKPEDIKIGVWYKSKPLGGFNAFPRICHQTTNSKGEHRVSFKGLFSFLPIYMSLDKFADGADRELLLTD